MPGRGVTLAGNAVLLGRDINQRRLTIRRWLGLVFDNRKQHNVTGAGSLTLGASRSAPQRSPRPSTRSTSNNTFWPGRSSIRRITHRQHDHARRQPELLGKHRANTAIFAVDTGTSATALNTNSRSRRRLLNVSNTNQNFIVGIGSGNNTSRR